MSEEHVDDAHEKRVEESSDTGKDEELCRRDDVRRVLGNGRLAQSRNLSTRHTLV